MPSVSRAIKYSIGLIRILQEMTSTNFMLAIVYLLVYLNQPASSEKSSHEKYVNYINRSTQITSREDATVTGELASFHSDPIRCPIAPLVRNKNFFTKKQMDQCEDAIYNSDAAQDKLTVGDYSYRVLLVRLLSLAYPDLYAHRYESYRDLRESGGPEVDQEKCISQLSHLADRAHRARKLGSEAKDINFFRLLDTFGRASSGVFDGHTTWLGSYDACLRMQVELPSGQRADTRYCLASLRFKNWSADENSLEQVAVFKAAVCLPKSCDSMSFKNKYALVQKLLDFNAREADLGAASVTSIYCLPDESSNLRTWWKSRPTLLLVGLVSAWLALLVFATYKDESRRGREKVADGSKTQSDDKLVKFYRSLSIAGNLRSLFNTDTPASPAASSNDQTKANGSERIVNLDMIEGIKVLAAIYVTSGHVMMISTGIIKNSKEMSESTSISYSLTNLMPAFAVNVFFSVTGILTAYLIFKQNQATTLVKSPVKWIVFVLLRYLRIMPTYAIVTLFCKHIARYIGDGPLWDYGTSSLAARRNCEQEPWAWTLLFGANFKSPLKHCIPSAWYLANDFQFFLVTPIFLALLHSRPKLGKGLLVTGIIAGYVAAFRNVLWSEANDIRPIALFMPHGFMTYITLLYENYTRPQYRIPAYLVGLLMGHSLYHYEIRRRAALERKQQQAAMERSQVAGAALVEPASDQVWPAWMVRRGVRICFWVAFIIIFTPCVGSRLSLSKNQARLLIAFIMPTYHLFYAISVGIYILLATTGHGNKFINGILSMKFWKPLARLSLCVVLVNVEVISYIMQTHRATHSLTNQYHTCLNLLSILCTYLAATVVCVLFESPFRAALNHATAFFMHRATMKEKAA